MLRTSVLRQWIVWLLLLLVCVFIVGWWVTRDKLPEEIRIASAREGGLYYKFAVEMGERLGKITGHRVHPLVTSGSVENLELLESGEADLAVVQAAALKTGEVARLAPLYREVCHIIARKDSGVTRIDDLLGKELILGPEGSGYRCSACVVLSHFGIEPNNSSVSFEYFTALREREEAAGAIVTTGLLNPDLCRLLCTNEFTLLSLNDAEAMCVHHPFFSKYEIPRGIFSGAPHIPPEKVSTISSTAFLVARKDASNLLVKAVLKALYETDLKAKIPTLITKEEARARHVPMIHPAARSYYEPYAGLDVLSDFLESLSAFKELLFALLAGGYLGWNRWRQVKRKKGEEELRVMKERLDAFLEETMRIEEAQMDSTDVEELQGYLDDITRIKLRALNELTHEDLRGDQAFAIFLAQCANLIRKIQSKILTYSPSYTTP